MAACRQPSTNSCGTPHLQTAGQKEDQVALSARNHLVGTIDEIVWGDVLVHVTVRVGDHAIESIITRRSAEEMGLEQGDKVTAVVKATEVMIAKG
jgi:molybdopterin-binding protein